MARARLACGIHTHTHTYAQVSTEVGTMHVWDEIVKGSVVFV